MNLAAEALVAVTGIFPKDPPDRADGIAAGMLYGKWRTAVKEFFDRSRPLKFKKTKLPTSYEAMTQKLNVSPDDPVTLASKISDPEIVRSYLTVVSNARLYVKEHWPQLQIENFAGPRTVEPGATFVSEMGMIYTTVNDPTTVLDEMLSHSLQAEQVEAMKTVFPSLFSLLMSLIEERKILELTKIKSWQVPWSKERVLRVLFQLPQNVSIAEAPRPKANIASVPEVKFKATDENTRGQRLEHA